MTKKIALIMVAAVASAFFAVADGAMPGFVSTVYFRSTGPDLYADQTVVRDGEVYALVWSRTDADGGLVSEFAIDAKGDVVDAANHKVVMRAPVAKDGRCPSLVYALDAAATALAEEGVFNVYLFDTRVRAEDGGEESVGELPYCNSYERVPAEVSVSGAARRGKSGSAGGEVVVSGKNAVATAVPAGARTAEIVAIAPPQEEGDAASVAVANTEPYIKYSLLAYESLDARPVDLGNGVNGNASAEDAIVLGGCDAKYKFFKLTRAGIRQEEGGQAQ